MRRVQLNNHLPVRTISLVAIIMLMLPLLILPVRQMIFFSNTSEVRKMEPDNEKLEKMVFTANAFSRLTFTRSHREFIYRGNMYDVHSIVKSGSQVVVYALWDKPESGLLLAFHEPDTQNGTTAVNFRVGFVPYFYVDLFEPGFITDPPVQIPSQIIRESYSNPYLGIFSPPPELLTSF